MMQDDFGNLVPSGKTASLNERLIAGDERMNRIEGSVAALSEEMAENTKDDPDFRVPSVDWDRTTKEVLTLEWIDGIHLSDHAALIAKGEVVTVNGRYGIRIIDIAATENRLAGIERRG